MSYHRLYFRRLLPLLVSALICISGFLTLMLYDYYKNKVLITRTSYDTITQLDSILYTAKTLSIASEALFDENCQTAQPILQKIVQSTEDISAIILIKDHRLSCSSYPQQNIDVSNMVAKKNNTPGFRFRSFKNTLAAQYTQGNNRSIVIIAPSIIKDTLTTDQNNLTLSLNLNEKTLTSQGLRNTSPKTYLTLEEHSPTDFSYSLQVGLAKPMKFKLLLHNYIYWVMGILSLTLCSYLLCWWIVRKLSSRQLDLHSAIKHHKIKPYVQPIFIARTRKVQGVEILARWHHPTLGFISPEVFIPLAEELDLIIPLTRSLMQQAAKALAPYIEQIPENFHIGFNISPAHCKNLDLIKDLNEFYKTIQSTKPCFVIEITERELIEVTDTTKELMRQLHLMKAKIALDDFGIGNSNLVYLRDFAIDYLKIDRSFVSRIGSDALSKNILDAIIEIAQSCHLECCAEGVETQAQLDYLAAKGVDYLQGFYFSRAVPIETFIKSEAFKTCLEP